MKRKTLVLLSMLALAIGSIGCGGGDDAGDGGEMDADNGEMAATGEMGSASISGTVSFNGEAPARIPLNLARECAEMHDGPVLSQNAVVGEDGALKWVFVYVKEGIEGTYAVPDEAVKLDQEGCVYEPHVFGVQTGQTIQIINSDPLLHNIHALPEENRPFNFGMPNEGDTRDREFREPEVMVRIKCDVHPWMLSWAGVLPHPFFDTSGDDGGFSIESLPAGDYVVEAWHEEFGTQTQNVTVGDGESVTLNFTFGEGGGMDGEMEEDGEMSDDATS